MLQQGYLCCNPLGLQLYQNSAGLLSTIVFTLLHLATTTDSTRMHNIHWNASNPIFRIDRTDNVFDINGGNHPWEYDQVNIVCPVYEPGTTSEHLQEKYIIYSVSKQEYDSCRITQSNPRIVAVCNRPYKHMYFTITFRSFTPTPGGLEFRPGQSYYFMSTSSKTDLHRRVGGSCSSHNMKVAFKVASQDVDRSSSDNNSIIDQEERHLTPPIHHPFPGHRRDGATPGRGGENGNINYGATYYYPSSEIEQAAAEQSRVRDFSSQKREDNSPFLHRSRLNTQLVQSSSTSSQSSAAASSKMHSTSRASSSSSSSVCVRYYLASFAALLHILLVPLLKWS